jgi:hypothetical protein
MITFCIAIMLSRQSYGQNKPDSTLHMKKVEGARETKRAGLTLTVLGAGSLIVAMVATGTSLNTTAAFGTAGLIGIAIGTPMWIIGAHNHKKYTKNIQSISVRLVANPFHSGLSVAIRF